MSKVDEDSDKMLTRPEMRIDSSDGNSSAPPSAMKTPISNDLLVKSLDDEQLKIQDPTVNKPIRVENQQDTPSSHIDQESTQTQL